mmetsp:Transcript_48450/g.80285  ORF Transcript_48450/g.80285 Transcript_48450/m.80285 type:complete len:209 (+) Transcript_48450:58-684(+)
MYHDQAGMHDAHVKDFSLAELLQMVFQHLQFLPHHLQRHLYHLLWFQRTRRLNVDCIAIWHRSDRDHLVRINARSELLHFAIAFIAVGTFGHILNLNLVLLVIIRVHFGRTARHKLFLLCTAQLVTSLTIQHHIRLLYKSDCRHRREFRMLFTNAFGSTCSQLQSLLRSQFHQNNIFIRRLRYTTTTTTNSFIILILMIAINHNGLFR